MAVVMTLRAADITPAQYDAARAAARWEEEMPEGVVLHAAWFEPDGLYVTDVWESQEHWERFLSERLGPAMQEVGLSSEPPFRVLPLHRRFIGPGVSGAGS